MSISITWWRLIGLAIVIVAFGYVGQNDFEDEIRYEDHYCQMVADGNWPNYKHVDCASKVGLR